RWRAGRCQLAARREDLSFCRASLRAAPRARQPLSGPNQGGHHVARLSRSSPSGAPTASLARPVWYSGTDALSRPRIDAAGNGLSSAAISPPAHALPCRLAASTCTPGLSSLRSSSHSPPCVLLPAPALIRTAAGAPRISAESARLRRS